MKTKLYLKNDLTMNDNPIHNPESINAFPPPPRRRPVYYRNQTEKAILDQAIALFGDRGKHAVSVVDIADAAGVKKSLIFYYFGSKDRLYRAAFLSLFEEFAETVAPRIVNLEPGIGQVERFVREHIAFLRSHPSLVRFMVRELLANETERSGILHELSGRMKPFRDTMLNAFKAGREKGEIRDIDPVHTLVNILSLNVFFFLGKPMVNLIFDSIDFERFENERENHVIDLLLHGLQTEEGSP